MCALRRVAERDVHTHIGVAGADHALELFARLRFQLHGHELSFLTATVDAHAATRTVSARTVQRHALGADDRDAIGAETRHRARHQVHDAPDFRASERVGPIQLQNHGGRSALFPSSEHAALRDHEVHARGLDPLHGLNRARELAFERSPEIHLLLELGRTELRLVENLETDATAAGQAGGSKLEPESCSAPGHWTGFPTLQPIGTERLSLSTTAAASSVESSPYSVP